MSTSRPLVTVAIPTHNRAWFLREALRSVLAQTFTDFELFVSDNASTDETRDVIVSFDDPRVHYTRLEHDIGPHANLTRCLRLGTAPYVTVLPDDDLMLPANLERKFHFLEQHPDLVMVHSAFNFIQIAPDSTQVLHENVNWVQGGTDRIETGPQVIRRLLTEDYWINWISAVMRRSLLGEESLDETDGPASDLGLCLGLARRGAVGYVAEPLVAFRLHPDTDTIRQGMGEFRSGGYQMTPAAIAVRKRVKERFLVEYGHELPGIREIRASSRRHDRQRLMDLIVQNSLPKRSLRVVWRLFRQAAGTDPVLMVTPRAVRFLLGSLAGRVGRKLAYRILKLRPALPPK